MFLLSRPDDKTIADFLKNRETDDYSYPEVGATKGPAPSGYNIDHNRQLLGIGMDAFEKAKTAIRVWKPFEMSWVDLCYTDTPIESDRTVAILIHHYGFYSLNAARIVYTIDESSAGIYSFGFAYGTLSEHGEIGEERFSVEYDEHSQQVSYDLYAFSRPGSLLAMLGYPLGRHLQKRFARESKIAMLSAASPTQ
jgi:uncharacterized protein (UPF0548 family)